MVNTLDYADYDSRIEVIQRALRKSLDKRRGYGLDWQGNCDQ